MRKSTILHINKISEDNYEVESILFVEDDRPIKFREYTCKSKEDAIDWLKLHITNRINNGLNFEYIS